MISGFDGVVLHYLGATADVATVQMIRDLAISKIANATDGPQQRQKPSGETIMEMIVAVPMIDTQISIKLANLIPNALHPSGVRQFIAAKTSFTAATAGGPIAWIAFVLAMTILAARTVPFAETCILHKAWRLAGFDRLITVDQLTSAGSEIVEEYGIVKVARPDIETYLNTLVRLGCMRDHPKGYQLIEKVALAL